MSRPPLLGQGGELPNSTVRQQPRPRRGGCATNQNAAKPHCSAQTGWLVQLPIIGGLNQPPRPLHQRKLRGIFIDVAATPPLPRRGLPSPECCGLPEHIERSANVSNDSVATVLAWLPGMSKKIIWIGMIVGSAIGNMLPLLWGGDAISMTGVLLSGVGGILGIWAGYRLGRNL